MAIKICKKDILKRVYFITNIVQSHEGETMQGALTSKSDSMGGVFDRFINTISEDIVFDRIILPEIKTEKNIEIIKDFYLYKPTKNGPGIAPDVFGLKVDGVTIPFVQFDKEWVAVEGTPQIEVKTFKAKDQMISLRNQDYDSHYLVLVDLKLRMDYLVPFFDKNLLNSTIVQEMKMDNSIFIKDDPKGSIKTISEIDFSNDLIGTIDLIAVTRGTDFMSQSTLCGKGIGPRRMKECKERKARTNKKTGYKLSNFAMKSPRNNYLYEFNADWYSKTNVNKTTTLYVDFSATNLENIEILAFNQNSVVIEATAEGCSFNEKILKNGEQYTIEFATLDRSVADNKIGAKKDNKKDNKEGQEYFMQKECATHLTDRKHKLIDELRRIIEKA